uniref:F-box domain-containing protein n=1 Tax=Anopheles dirus TaxID=7168 RepID=A0A182N8D4_9DIPT
MDPSDLQNSRPIVEVSSSNNAPVVSQQNCELGRKRKLSTEHDEIEDGPNAKCPVIDAVLSIDCSTELVTQSHDVNILDLSDEILLLVLHLLDSDDLLPLSKVCTRLQRLIADKTLWTEADFTTKPLKTLEVHQRIKYLQPASTKVLKLRGMTTFYPSELWNVPTLTREILSTLEDRSPLLEHLELTEAYLDMNEIGINMFPHTLRALTLKKCALSVYNIHTPLMLQPHTRSILSNIYKHLVRLEELTIEYCAWFDTHDLLVLSKLPNLRYLSLKGCVNIKDSVPYASLATRFGFKKLEVLDLRDTPISDSDISCFNTVQSLKELRLECPEHLRTERGLHEYNEAERVRVEQLHRIAAPELFQNNDVNQAHNEAPAEGAGLAPPIPRPRRGGLAIHVINGNAVRRDNRIAENLARIIRAGPDIIIHNERPPPPVARERVQGPPSPPLEPGAPQAIVGLPDAADRPVPQQAGAQRPMEHVPNAPLLVGGIENNNNNNNVDRQHIVRIINRDLLHHRRGNRELGRGQLLIRRHAEQVQINAQGPRAPDVPAGRLNRHGDGNPPVARGMEQPGINVQLRYNEVADAVQVDNQQGDRQQQQQQQNREQNNPAAQHRILPHVIIMHGNIHENIQEIVHNANGNHHQLLVNLGIGQLAPNYVQLISDRGISSFGVSRNHNFVEIVMEGYVEPVFSKLERLSVRNYKDVTDRSLDHLETAAPRLQLLDVTGTSVTAQGIRNFKLSRPRCVVLSDYDQMANRNFNVANCAPDPLQQQ